MSSVTDGRIPVVFENEVAVAPTEAAWLVEGVGREGPATEHFAVGGAHAAGCACCGARGPAAEAFSRLFLRRARGEVGFARVRVAVRSEAGREAVVAALREDAFVAARFRAVP